MSSRCRCCSSIAIVVAIAGLAAGCGGDDTPAGGAANQGDIAGLGDIADVGDLGDLGDMEGVEGVEGLGEALAEYEDIMEDLDMDAFMEDPEAATDQLMSSFVDEGAWATVIVGDERYEFDQLYCVTIGGAVGVQNMGRGFDLNIDIPPDGWETSGDDGWEPPYIMIGRDDEPYFRYQAGGTVWEDQPPRGSVDVTTFDGYSGSGVVSFYDSPSEWDAEGNPIEKDTIPGSFEFSCPK